MPSLIILRLCVMWTIDTVCANEHSFCGVCGSSGPALGVATIADVGETFMLILINQTGMGTGTTRQAAKHLCNRPHGVQS
jgi:hypothetical protein